MAFELISQERYDEFSEDERAELLAHLLVDPNLSWFNAINDMVEVGDLLPNTHAAYERLLAGVLAIGTAEGFPLPLFRRMMLNELDIVASQVIA